VTLVRDLREHRVPPSAEELACFEAGVLAGFVLARLGGLAGGDTASAPSASAATGYSTKP
jgi:hypothetical protein